MRVMALFSTSFFAKYLRVGEDGPGRGHLSHTDTFLVYFQKFNQNILIFHLGRKTAILKLNLAQIHSKSFFINGVF